MAMDGPLDDQGSSEPEINTIDDAFAAALDELNSQDDSTESASLRDERGRFKSKETDTSDVPALEAPEEEISDQAAEVEEDEEQETAPIVAPLSWSAEDRKIFATLPREAQEIVTRRERERDSFLNQKSAEVSQQQYEIEDVTSALDEYEASWKSLGQTRSGMIRELLGAHYAMQQDPVGTLLAIAQQNGIDANTLVQGLQNPQAVQRQAPQQQQYRDPRVDEIYSMMTQQQTAASHNAIMSFAQATDQKGNPLRPHFQDLADDITALIPRIKAANPTASPEAILQDAYDRACWANPAIREAQLQQQTARKEAERLQQVKAKTNQAKRSAASITGSPTASTTQQTPDDLDSLLRGVLNGSIR